MMSIAHLHGSLYAGSQWKRKSGQCDPKTPPLSWLMVVSPEVDDTARLSFVEDLLDHDDSITPGIE